MAEQKKPSLLQSAFKTAVIGTALFFLTGIFDYAWAHDNVGGQALIQALNPIIQSFYDFIGITDASLWAAEAISSNVSSVNPDSYGNAALDIYNNW